jgi:hypothetical protein
MDLKVLWCTAVDRDLSFEVSIVDEVLSRGKNIQLRSGIFDIGDPILPCDSLMDEVRR